MSSYLYWFGALLALVGGALSFYFYGVYRGWISAQQGWIPPFCRMNSTTCINIVDSRYGRIGRVPNAFSGSLFLLLYAYSLMATSFGWLSWKIPFIMGVLSIIGGIYLVVGLAKLKVLCPICITVHTLNLLILLLQIPALELL